MLCARGQGGPLPEDTRWSTSLHSDPGWPTFGVRRGASLEVRGIERTARAYSPRVSIIEEASCECMSDMHSSGRGARVVITTSARSAGSALYFVNNCKDS